MEKIIVTGCCMVVFLIITLLSYSRGTRPGNIVSRETKITHSDTIPSTSKTFPMENGVSINGNAITYYGRGYKIVTDGENDRITALYYKGERISDEKISSHAATAKEVIKEQREIFENQVQKGTKQNKKGSFDTGKTENGKTAMPDKVDPEDKLAPESPRNGSETYVKASTNNDRQNRNAIDPATVPYGYKITEGNTIRYFLRDYEIVTQNGKKVIALYHKGQKIPDENLSSYNEMAIQMVNEVQEGINKRVKEWRKRSKN